MSKKQKQIELTVRVVKTFTFMEGSEHRDTWCVDIQLTGSSPYRLKHFDTQEEAESYARSLVLQYQ